MTDEEFDSLLREFEAAKRGEPLIKAFPPVGFDDLLEKALKGLPVYPRRRAGTMLFKSPKPARLSGHASHVGQAFAKAINSFTNELGAMRKALIVGQVETLMVNARREYEAGRISAYAFDQLKNRQHSLLNSMEAHK